MVIDIDDENEIADRAAIDPAFRARLELALQRLHEAVSLGVARVVRTADGGIAIEKIEPKLH